MRATENACSAEVRAPVSTLALMARICRSGRPTHSRHPTRTIFASGVIMPPPPHAPIRLRSGMSLVSGQEPASIKADDLAGAVTGVTHQKQDGAGGVFRRARPPQRHAGHVGAPLRLGIG